MTGFHTGFSGQLPTLWTSTTHFPLFIRQWITHFSIIGLLAIFLSPVVGAIEPGVANAQNVRNSARKANHTRVQRRHSRRPSRVRGRTRAVSKPKKSFLGSLFANKPARRTSNKPFRGLKSFMDDLQGKAHAKPSPSSLRATYEKAMREAALRDTMSANERLQSRSIGTARGKGRKKARSDAGARNYSSSWGRGRYRTMCVRMCDGYYFPVSFKTGSRRLGSDEQYCNSNCYNAPTKLFYYSNPGGSIENMRSLDGTLYKEIANAFKYRKEYVAECRCKAEPWSKQARQQHESWEIEEEIVQDRAKQDRNKPSGEVDLTSAAQARSRPSYAQY